MSGVEVRRLVSGDAEEVERFASAFDEPIDRAACERFLANEGHHLLVAYLDGQPAGFVSATEILHPDKRPELFLNELGVVDALRRRGAATALLNELKRLARERDMASIWVLTDEENAAAVATYQRAGGRRDTAPQVMFEIEPEVDATGSAQ